MEVAESARVERNAEGHAPGSNRATVHTVFTLQKAEGGVIETQRVSAHRYSKPRPGPAGFTFHERRMAESNDRRAHARRARVQAALRTMRSILQGRAEDSNPTPFGAIRFPTGSATLRGLLS